MHRGGGLKRYSRAWFADWVVFWIGLRFLSKGFWDSRSVMSRVMSRAMKYFFRRGFYCWNGYTFKSGPWDFFTRRWPNERYKLLMLIIAGELPGYIRGSRQLFDPCSATTQQFVTREARTHQHTAVRLIAYIE